MPFNEWIGKQTVMYPYNYGILLCNKKEPTNTHNNLNKSPENFAEFKKPVPKGYTWMVPFI